MAAVPVAMPKLGWEMQEGYLQEWLVEDGGTVQAGEPLYTLETDKVEQTIEAPASGVVRIKSAPEETYPVGQLLAEIEVES
jgi:pyruvate/2-oxoglutarate dehydrogenase complex dihydrolipoamide acyltransferase (E2) component